MKKDKPITWSIKGEAQADRTLSYEFSVTGIGDIESCIAMVDRDEKEPVDFKVKVEKPGALNWKVPGDKKETMVVSFSCRGKNGLESGRSPWQTFTVPAVGNASGTNTKI